MSVYLELTLDVTRTGVQDTLSGAYMGDREKEILIVLSKGSEAYTPPGGSMAILYTEKPDGTHGMYRCAVENGYVVAPIAPQMVTVAGHVRCQLEIVTAVHTVLYCPEFILDVARPVSDEIDVESENDFPALDEVLTSVRFLEAHGVTVVSELPEATEENPINENKVVYLVGSGFYLFEDDEWMQLTDDAWIETIAELQETVEALQQDSHTHGNINVLESISGTKITHWNEAYSRRHMHENKLTLDGITDEKVAAWEIAGENQHEHTNKGVLNKLSEGYQGLLFNGQMIGITATDGNFPDPYPYRRKFIYHIGSTNPEYAGLYYSDGVTWIPIARNKVVQNSHVHSNQSALDNVTAEKITAWNDAVTKKHTHSNKAVLDTVTSDVVSNSHAHANKAALDTITAADLEGYDDAAAKKHTHANKAVLDTVTSDVVSNSHEHANKAVLDTVTADVVSNTHTHSNKATIDKLTESNGALLFDGDTIGGGIQAVASANVLPANVSNGSVCVALNDYENIEALSYPDTQTDEFIEVSFNGKGIRLGTPTYNARSINDLISDGQDGMWGEIHALRPEYFSHVLANILTRPVVENIADNDYTDAELSIDEADIMLADSCEKKYLVEVILPIDCRIPKRLDSTRVAVPVYGIYTFEDLTGTYRDMDRYTFKEGWNVLCTIYQSTEEHLYQGMVFHSSSRMGVTVINEIDINEYVSFETDSESHVSVVDVPEAEIFAGLIQTRELKKKGLYVKVGGTWARVDAQEHTHPNKRFLDEIQYTLRNYNDVVEKKHTHANKDALDKITAQDGIPAYNGKSIYSYIHDVLNTFRIVNDRFMVNAQDGLATFGDDEHLYVDPSAAGNINDNRLEVLV